MTSDAIKSDVRESNANVFPFRIDIRTNKCGNKPTESRKFAAGSIAPPSSPISIVRSSATEWQVTSGSFTPSLNSQRKQHAFILKSAKPPEESKQKWINKLDVKLNHQSTILQRFRQDLSWKEAEAMPENLLTFPSRCRVDVVSSEKNFENTTSDEGVLSHKPPERSETENVEKSIRATPVYASFYKINKFKDMGCSSAAQESQSANSLKRSSPDCRKNCYSSVHATGNYFKGKPPLRPFTRLGCYRAQTAKTVNFFKRRRENTVLHWNNVKPTKLPKHYLKIVRSSSTTSS